MTTNMIHFDFVLGWVFFFSNVRLLTTKNDYVLVK